MEIKAHEKLPKEAKDIRREVFIDEQGFKNEFDDIENIYKKVKKSINFENIS